MKKLWGPLSGLGLGVALAVFVLDQATKWWVLAVLNLDEGNHLTVAPFLELVMAWNKGVSYGLLETGMQELLVALSLVISAFIVAWIARAQKPLAAWALGLVLGGAIGNALDRLIHGAVADFVLLHWQGWNWYVFNVADIAIVAGVILLIYDGLLGQKRA